MFLTDRGDGVTEVMVEYVIIILKNDQFSALKEDELVKVNLIVKLKEKFNLITLLLFNKYILSLNKDSITLY